ncbi:MAG: ornithine carbamoyltransferase [Omnitrophica bacterium RBG_13_46_9]|nr:MAG: ornithine carbamoyltransferase [Omnitrophica bacterium RBG_13_46_9]
MKKDLISVKDLTKGEILGLFRTAKALKSKPLSKKSHLKYKSLALVFQKPSNRTRVSFEVGMAQLGGQAIYLGPNEVRIGERESVKDAAMVLSRYVDGIITRTFGHEDAVTMAEFSSVPVINGLSNLSHPCQGLSDLFTINEYFGNRRVKISFVGDGNNVLHSLLLGCSILGRDICAATPEKCQPNADILKEARRIAAANKSRIELTDEPEKCVKSADVIYTDVWVSMGCESERADRLNAFKGFQVNRELVSHAKKGVLIMHCLPAHRGEEITDDILDSKNSIVYEQAENRLHVQKAILLKLLGTGKH